MKTLLYILVCPLLLTQMSGFSQGNPQHEGHSYGQNNSASHDDHHPGLNVNISSLCDPKFLLSGLYDPATANDQNPPIFSDPLLKAELISGGFFGKEKEYGDVDGDGDVDILYVTNTHELWFIPNEGSITAPDYRAASKVYTGIANAFSFRLYDWSADNVIDLVVLEEVAGVITISLYLDMESQIGAPHADVTLMDASQIPLNNAQLIEIGDVDGDQFPELFVSGQGTAINGTAIFRLDSTGWTFPPVYALIPPQTYETPFFVEEGISFPCPELFDADCDGDLDLFISDPTWVFEGGGHVEYYENVGGEADFLVFTEVSPNPYGLDDIPLPGMELTCDWIITRFADFFGDGFAEAIAYNPCHPNSSNGEMFYYRNVLDKDTTTSVQPLLPLGAFTLFPNPASEKLSITWDVVNLENMSFHIYDSFGRLQSVHQTGQNTTWLDIDVSHLTGGTYIIKIVADKDLFNILKFVKA